MSMNLNASSKSGTIDLWQTPTQISYTILPPNSGTVKGKAARDALLRYCEWVRYSTNGVVYESDKKYNDGHKIVKEHLKYIESHLNDKGLTVWVM